MTYIGPQSAAEARRIEIEQAIARTGLISAAMEATGASYAEVRTVWNHMQEEAPKSPGRVRQPCGTYAAYNRHRRHAEDPCDPCIAAYAVYRQGERERAKARRAAA